MVFFPQGLSEDLQHASVYCYSSLRFYLFFLIEKHLLCTVKYVKNIYTVYIFAILLKNILLRVFWCIYTKNFWVVLTQFWVKYGQTQPLGYI